MVQGENNHLQTIGEKMSNVQQEQPQKPKAKLIGADGNVFNLITIAGRALKQNGQREKADEMYRRITKTAKSYDEALVIIMEYVDVH